MPFLSWAQIQVCLEMIPEWEFRANYHQALTAYMSGAAFGGMKETRPQDLLASFARPEWMKDDGPGSVRLRLKGKEADGFRLALRMGLVSQRLLTHFADV